MADPNSETLDALCAAAVQYGGSDLLLHEGRVPQIRMDGRLSPLETAPLDAAFFDALWQKCGVPPEATDYDTSLTSPDGGRFRINLLHQMGKRAAVLRRIRGDVADLPVLGLPAELLQKWVSRKSGIILVSGATGSGKSTTLAAMLEWVNANQIRHVVTIEDPIEFIFQSKQSIFTQREVGIDTPSFSEGLRRALRQNPDVILIGEIRDVATASTAIQASEVGHLVLATLHASTCSEAIERMELFFSAAERDSVRRTLSAQLLGILCQRLLPSTSEKLVLSTEFFECIGAASKYISEGRLDDLQDLISRGDGKTARNFLTSMVHLVHEGKITEEIALSVAQNPQELRRVLRGIDSSMEGTRR